LPVCCGNGRISAFRRDLMDRKADILVCLIDRIPKQPGMSVLLLPFHKRTEL
jgi:hypothetical protein